MTISKPRKDNAKNKWGDSKSHLTRVSALVFARVRYPRVIKHAEKDTRWIARLSNNPEKKKRRAQCVVFRNKDTKQYEKRKKERRDPDSRPINTRCTRYREKIEILD